MAAGVSFSLSAPGKIILIGEHSVLYKKRGLAVTISKRTTLSFKEKREVHDQLTLNLKNLKSLTVWDFKSVYDFINRQKPLLCEAEKFSINTPDLINHEEYILLINEFVDMRFEKLESNIKSALAGIFYVIGAMLWCSNVDLCPFDIEIDSDLIMSAGLGSSASFSVCICAAVYHYLKLKAFIEENNIGENNICNAKFKPYSVTLPSSDQDVLTEQDLEVITQWAYCVEKIMHGKPSGLDNNVCTFGAGMLINVNESLNGKTSLERLKHIPPLNILLINTGVERRTVDLVKRVTDLRGLVPESVDAVLDAMDITANSYIKLILQLSNAEISDPSETYQKLEKLMDVSHGLLVTLGVSHPRLDEACMITKRRGVHSKLTGAGGGGCAFSLIPPSCPESEVKSVILDLQSCGFAVQQLTLGAPGLQIHH